MRALLLVTVILYCLAGSALANVDWSNLTSDQLKTISPVEFGLVNATEIASIPPQALSGLLSSQLANISSPACSGLTGDQMLNIPGEALGGISDECIAQTTPAFWSVVTAAQLSNVSDLSFIGFTYQQWAEIPPAAVATLSDLQALSMAQNACRAISADQFEHFNNDFLAALEESCVKQLTPEALLQMRPIQMRALQRKFRWIAPECFFNIPPQAFAYLEEGFSFVCAYILPAQVVQLKPRVFFSFPASCADEMPFDSWEAILPTQISEISLDVFAASFTWTHIAQLSNQTLAAINEAQWNVLATKTKSKSTILDLEFDQIFRLVLNAHKALLNYEPDRASLVGGASSFDLKRLQSLKQAVEKNFPAQSLQMVPFPGIFDVGLFDGWTWMHFVFLNDSTIPKSTGMTAAQLARLATAVASPSPLNEYIPFSGIRAGSVGSLLTNPAVLVGLTPELASQILPDTFSRFTAPMIDSIFDSNSIANVTAPCWEGVAPDVIRDINFNLWVGGGVSAAVIEHLTCAQVAALDKTLVYNFFEENSSSGIALAFKGAFERCDAWHPSMSNGAIVALIIGAGVGVCIVAIVAVSAVVACIRRSRAAALEAAPLLP